MGLTRLVLCFVVIASVVHVPSALAAQIGAAGDLKEVQEYRLTEPALKQVMAATRNMLVAMKNDPRYQRLTKLEAELKTLDAKDQPTDADTKRMEKIVEELESIRASTNVLGNDRSLAEIEAAVAKEPLVANALKSAGISARDYAKFMGAFIQAAMIQGLQKDGAIKEIPKDLIPENVKFAKEHAAEFAAFMKELEAFETKEP
jgi:hypothetical protein